MMYQYKCCRFCSNNPTNNPNASGVCSCVLPYMETPILIDTDNPLILEHPDRNSIVYYTTSTDVIK